MYMAFTEEQAIQIRKKTGLHVVQFKYCIRNKIDIWFYKLKKIVDAVEKTLDSAFGVINDFVDNIRFVLEDISDKCKFPTTRRYRLVKNLSKLGYDKREMRIATRHTWLARSNC